MRLIYYSSGSRTNPQALNGVNMAVGNLYCSLDLEGAPTPSIPVNFTVNKPDGSVFSRPENGAPFDLNGGSTATLNAYPVVVGTYTVTTTNGSGTVLATATFTVGTVTPPPSTDKEIVRVEYNATKVDVQLVNNPNL